jgi:lambda family phage portal protein
MLRSTARDGHVLLRKVRGWKESPYKFAVQPIESDSLDVNYNAQLPSGNIVVMGVEMNRWKKKVAYHLLTNHPGDYATSRIATPNRRERVDADEIIHLYKRNRIGQTIGVSWLAPVMDLMEMLRGYEEAELISARSEACKGGFFYNDMTGEAGMTGPPTKPDGIRKKMVPGQMDVLPYGWKYQANNPTHPNGNYSGYRQGVLRGIASGLSCSYNILANDLVGVSYSSLRGGLLDEREIYKMLQEWFIAHLEIPVFEAWLESALLTDRLVLPQEKTDKFNKPFFVGRRWDWVDPRKDIEAAALAVKHGFASTREIVGEKGKYVVDIAKEQAADNELQDRFGLKWGEETVTATQAPEEPELDADGKPIPGTEPEPE